VALRIVAGEFGGRRLAAPADSRVRPTADRVREAWFSILGASIAGARVLDLFAGSGALGLEAISRGAARAEFVELNRASLAALDANIASLDVADRTAVHRGDALRFAGRLAAGAFDVALADPPYTADFAERLVALFRKVPFAGILAVEHRADRVVDGDETRRWGDTAVTFVHAP
jgi:16S rRNA (guanine966-N2)-methyltransferase